MRIEAAALSSFQSDITSNPELARELSSTTSILNNLPTIPSATCSQSKEPSSSVYGGGRFGDQTGSNEESLTLVRGREKALNTVSKKLEKKSKWLEAVNSEGKTYYWNRDTYETIWEKPKVGYLTIEEQKTMDISGPSTSSSSDSSGVFRHNPYGSWQTVKEETVDPRMPDLELPDLELPVETGFVEVPTVLEKKVKTEVEFEEKRVEMKSKLSGNIEFRKRGFKGGSFARNVKKREGSPWHVSHILLSLFLTYTCNMCLPTFFLSLFFSLFMIVTSDISRWKRKAICGYNINFISDTVINQWNVTCEWIGWWRWIPSVKSIFCQMRGRCLSILNCNYFLTCIIFFWQKYVPLGILF